MATSRGAVDQRPESGSDERLVVGEGDIDVAVLAVQIGFVVGALGIAMLGLAEPRSGTISVAIRSSASK